MSFYKNELIRIQKISYKNSKQIKTVIGIKKQMDMSYCNDINLDVLSTANFVSKFHMLRLFKKYYGQTPRQYLIDKRIEKSKILLQEGKSVTESCFDVGLESIGSFSVLFKSKTGISPGVYQKEQLSRKEL